MINYLLVFIGGGLGSISRFYFSSVFGVLKNGFPLATLLSNVVSCLILGALAAYTIARATDNNMGRLFLFGAAGFCGGFSTFSTFSMETFQLLSNGHILMALGNMLMNVLVCLAAVAAGFYAARLF